MPDTPPTSAAANAKVAHREYMREWARERRAARRMSPPPPGRCARRLPHAAHVARWHGDDRQTYCDGQPEVPTGSWFVICKVRPGDIPTLVGPFSNEADAHAYVTFSEEDTPYCWVVQSQEVDDDA